MAKTSINFHHAGTDKIYQTLVSRWFQVFFISLTRVEDSFYHLTPSHTPPSLIFQNLIQRRLLNMVYRNTNEDILLLHNFTKLNLYTLSSSLIIFFISISIYNSKLFHWHMIFPWRLKLFPRKKKRKKQNEINVKFHSSSLNAARAYSDNYSLRHKKQTYSNYGMCGGCRVWESFLRTISIQEMKTMALWNITSHLKQKKMLIKMRTKEK